jgi:transposase
MFSAYFKAMPSIPKETVRAASASFGRGNFYIQVGEQLNGILGEFQRQQHLAWNAGDATAGDLSLALITFFQFVEGLTDEQASDAVRTRLDWKFALHLSLLPQPLGEMALCQFRERILSNGMDAQAYQVLIDGLVRSVPLLDSRMGLPGSLEIVSLVCSVNRLNQFHQAMNRVLEVLAARFSPWLRAIALPHWYGRYNPASARFGGSILPDQQRFRIEEIGSDIQHLLEQVSQSGSPEIRELSEIRFLEQVWLQHLETVRLSPGNQLTLFDHTDCESCSQKTGGGRHPA